MQSDARTYVDDDPDSSDLDNRAPLANVDIGAMPEIEQLVEVLVSPSRPVTAVTPPMGIDSRDVVAGDAPPQRATAAPEGDGRRRRWRVGRASKDTKAQDHVTTTERIVVAAGGGGQFTTIGEAIQQAAPGARIEVHPGHYAEGLTIDRPIEIVGIGSVDSVIIESAETSCVLMQADAAIIRNVSIRCRVATGGERYYGVNIPMGRLLLEDCKIVSDSLACVAIHGKGTSPILRHCLLQTSLERAIAVYDFARGLIEECEIISTTMPVRVSSHADPMFRHCLIHGGRFGGVGIAEQGRGRFEECDIVENGHHGVSVRHSSHVVLFRCRINRNGWNAVSVADNSGATVEHCDLTGNQRMTWDIKDSARPQVEMRDNKEA
jgi:hypothetical protein